MKKVTKVVTVLLAGLTLFSLYNHKKNNLYNKALSKNYKAPNKVEENQVNLKNKPYIDLDKDKNNLSIDKKTLNAKKELNNKREVNSKKEVNIKKDNVYLNDNGKKQNNVLQNKDKNINTKSLVPKNEDIHQNGKILYTPTYDGSNQAVHPKILFFPNGWKGYRYWLGITPYPNTNDDYENPQILVSNNGINFIPLPGSKKPLFIPQDVKQGGHYSDIHLNFVNNTMEVYFRYNPAKKGKKYSDNGKNYLYVTKSTDGRTWSDKKLLFKPDTFKIKCAYLSPIINYEDGKYKVWFTNYNGNLYYTETKDWNKFKELQVCNFKDKDIKIWHQDLIKTDLGYEFICCGYKKEFINQNLYYSRSKDGVNFEPLKLVIKPSKSKYAFDNKLLYRPSLLKTSNGYKVYYSAMNMDGKWHIGIANLFNK